MLRLRVSSAISDPTVSFLFPFAGRSLSFLVTLSIFTNMGESLIGSSSVYSRSLSTMTNDMSPLILYSVLPIYNILQTKYRLLQTANCFLFLFFFVFCFLFFFFHFYRICGRLQVFNTDVFFCCAAHQGHCVCPFYYAVRLDTTAHDIVSIPRLYSFSVLHNYLWLSH